MSKFTYQAEGELNSKYLIDLLQEYLAGLLQTNDTKGIEEDEFKINVNSSKFGRWLKDRLTRFKSNETVTDNYNKILSTRYVYLIQDKLKIFLQTNVLEAKQIFNLKQTLNAINLGIAIPEIEENREKEIIKSQKRFLKCLDDIKYLQYADSEYVLFDSPAKELKPFLSEKVSAHKVNYQVVQSIVKKLVDLRYHELTTGEFEPYEVTFKARQEDFYHEQITDNGVGEEIEAFIRAKMQEKLDISKQDDRLVEDNDADIAKIDALLKRLKLSKIEQMMQTLIKLKTDVAKAKEVIDNCKEVINQSTISNKASIFFVMDNKYYALSKKCETLQQKIKVKLQVVDKQKVFDMLEHIQVATASNEESTTTLKSAKIKTSKSQRSIDDNLVKPDIASNLYDEDDEDDEIDITEDDGADDAEEEIVIDE